MDIFASIDVTQRVANIVFDPYEKCTTPAKIMGKEPFNQPLSDDTNDHEGCENLQG